MLGSYGAGKRSRTPDLRITNALLYQLSYAGPTENHVFGEAPDHSGFFVARKREPIQVALRQSHKHHRCAGSLGYAEKARRTVATSPAHTAQRHP